jgi:hypothetical protein
MSKMQSISVVVLWSVAGLLTPTVVFPAVPQYTVTVPEHLNELTVRACFEGSLPDRLWTRNERAPGLLRNVRFHRQNAVVELKPEALSLSLEHAGDSGCVVYRVDLSAIGPDQWRTGNWRVQDAIILDPDLWLWLPDTGRGGQRFRLDFELPPGYDLSAPWKRIGRTGQTVSFEVRERMPEWEARMAIGRFDVELIELAGGRLRYALLAGEPAADTAAIRDWITSGARALVSTYGRLPVPGVQLLVVPIGRGNEPVPWGEVKRGGGDAVHLYIDQRQSADAFMDDWVLAHELGHLLHPYIDSRDRWLSEGLASYYQNVLRARTGLISVALAWNRLHAGFERGARGTQSGRSLAEVSESMMRDRAFMRVYWSGAAVALLADVELRKRSDGRQSLDTALKALHTCCLPADRSWSARELMQKLDQLTETSIFMDLYRQHVNSDDFPELKTVYAELGLKPVSNTRVDFDPKAYGAGIRSAIMTAPEG